MADQDFEKLLATIEKLNAQLNTLTSKIATARQELQKMEQPSQRESAGRSIGGIQSAINRLEAKLNQLSAQALRESSEIRAGEAKGAPYGRVPGEGFKVLGPAQVRQGLEAANVQGKIDAEVRRFARDVALRFQRSLIEGAVQSRLEPINNRQKDILEVAIRDRKAIADRAAYIRALNDEYDAMDAAENAKYAAPRYQTPTTTEIPTPSGPPPPTKVTPGKGLDPSLISQLGLGKKLSEREKQEQEAINAARQLIAAERKYARALEIAAQQGYSPEDLKRFRTRGTGGIEQLQFQRTDEFGRQRNLDLFVNQAGKATPGISNQFRTFGQGVVRDIGELTKWSIALAAVYGPMRKVQELTQLMIENQTRLAEAVVSVSSSFIDQADIFNAAAQAANLAGESIGGVIDAFTQAYRAAGGGGNEVERFAAATDLLNDSLILSKLSSLDQAQAIDTLSAAMRQANGSLTGGTELLDSWVRVTKVANIDLASLATGFAVLGDSADAAGIGVNELNGLLAAIAETGVASGRELANSARRVVGFFQTDQARAALENIGVAFEDSTGKARPLLDVMQEIADLRDSGVLGDTEFSTLTQQIGQGVRGSATISTLIENFSRVREVAEESSRASGDAQVALAKQLETVQTSLTRLGNAFQELAQTLGTEGGFLGLITEGVNGLTAMVRIFEGLVSVLGKATPAMAAFIAASALAKYRGYGGLGESIQGLGKDLREPSGTEYRTGHLGNLGPYIERGRGFVGRNILGSNLQSGAIQGLLAAAIPAIMNATNEEDRFGGTKATLNLIGGIGGGILGALAGPQGAAAGAILGTAISEAFVNSTIARKTDIFGYTAPTLGDSNKVSGDNVAELDKRLAEAEQNIYKSIGYGNEALGRFIANSFASEAEQAISDINSAIASGDKGKLDRTLLGINALNPIAQEALRTAGVNDQFVEQAFAQGRQIEFSPEYVGLQMASGQAREEFQRAEAARLARGGTTRDEDTAFSELVRQNKDAYSQLITTIKETSRQDLRNDRASGEIRGTEYGRRATALGGFDTRALQYYTALGNQVDLLTGGGEDAAKAFEILNNVIVGGSEDALPQITSLSGEIQNLINLLSDPKLNLDQITKDFGGVEEAQKQLEELQTTMADIITDINQQVLVGRLDIPDVQGDVNKPLSREDFGQIEQRANQLQDEFYQGFLQIPDDMYDALKGSWDEWAQIVEDSGDIFYQRVSEIDPQFFQQAFQELLEQQKLKSQKETPFGIEQVDLPGSRAGELQGMIDYFGRYLSQNFPQYEQKPEQFGVIFNDYVTSVLHGDNLAMKLALEKLVDLNQKQLDGMYNIPEGATFWVPLTAAYYRPKSGGEGGLPSVGEGDPANTSATDRNTQAINANTLALYENRYDKMNAGARVPLPHADRYDKMNKFPENPPHADRYDKMNEGAGERRQVTAESLVQQLQNFFKNITGNAGGQFPFRHGPRPGGFGDTGASYRTPGGAAPIQPQVNARLDMRIDNQTQLIVDGRILASVISPYLSQELLRLEASQGTITKRYVI